MLWVFGDSFSVDIKHLDSSNESRSKYNTTPPFFPLENNWTSIVSEKLTGTTEHVNEAMAGCANEYIYHNMRSRMGEFKTGDYVIISLTAPDRRWLVERCPHLANWSHCQFDPDAPDSVTKSENKAIQGYARHLYSETASIAISDAIFWAMVHLAKEYESIGVKFLILPGFTFIPGVVGTLNEASTKEFDSDKTLNDFYKKTNDSRWNHFSEENHKILANKVVRFFTNFETVDLTTDFKTSIYTKNNI